MPIVSFYSFSKETEVFTPKPTPATRQVPDWYKNQNAYFGNENDFLKQGFSSSTVKKCMPVFDGMTAGYILYAPCDIFIDATNPDKLEWSIPATLNFIRKDLVAVHTKEQTSEYPRDESKYHKEVFRIMPFWAVGTENGYSCLFTHPLHRDPLPFKAFEAIVDTDKFITDGHLSFFIEKGFKGVIERGTPLVQVIPFKRESYESKLISGDESAETFRTQRFFVRSKFKHAYKLFMRSKKEYK
jgi:hypothetical protein